jgi:hypothetical protein
MKGMPARRRDGANMRGVMLEASQSEVPIEFCATQGLEDRQASYLASSQWSSLLEGWSSPRLRLGWATVWMHEIV